MEIHVRVKRWHLVVLTVLAVAVVGGVAYASIPDSGGVYTACKLNATGTIRLIDPSLGSSSLLGHCTSLESQITWNRTGQNGVSPTVAQLAADDSHCVAGGASITDASGNVAYVCNGRPFSGSFQSPNGQYSLQVSDQGVTLAAPGASLALGGGTLAVSSSTETVQVAGDRTESIGGDDALTVGGSRTQDVGGNESLDVTGSRTTSVAQSESVTIGKDRSEQVGADDTVTVGGDRSHTVQGNDTLAVGKNRTESVAGDETVHITGSKTEKDDQNYQHEAGTDFTIKSAGDGLIESNGSLSFKAAVINNN